MHILFLISNLFEFNYYCNFSFHISNILYFLFEHTNNINLKFSVLFLKLGYIKKKRIEQFSLNFYKIIKSVYILQYKENFILSKKTCRFINYLSIFYLFYKNINKKSDYLIYFILYNLNFNKYKIECLNCLLICFLDNKLNSKINYFYYKYFLLDILNEISFLNLSFSKKFEKKNKDIILDLIKKYKKKYKKFYIIHLL